MSKPLTALEKLRGQVKSNYQSSFDFATSEIDSNQIAMVVSEESKLIKATTQYVASIKDICNSLYQVSQIMKKDGSFMNWYSYMGFTKDKVSELLKRQQLFLELPEYESWIASLSILAIKELTKKEMTEELRFEVAQLGLKSMEEIKYWISEHFAEANAIPLEQGVKVMDDTEDDQILDLFKDLATEIKHIRDSEKIVMYKKKLPALKKYLKELEALIEEKELETSNENNMKFF